MSDTVIQVENLGKKYRIGHQAAQSSLRETLSGAVKRALGLGSARKTYEDFWALNGVSFEVKRGECVGIIGRNGAGKSTLLKILSRITDPTEGRIKLKGRVASLLEVGTGFHGELSGRENIFLNGAILGMKRDEIRAKFDEIVEFAEVEKFLDTPVKWYSSGMYMRLAVAVASHLDPEILIIDEVLAVGDAAFQKKCLGRMKDVALSGRTVLFVSHNMSAVTSMCDKGVFLKQGKVDFIGTAVQAVSRYSEECLSSSETTWIGDAGDENVRLLKTWVRPLDESKGFDTASPLEIGMELDVKKPIEGLIVGFWLRSQFEYELAYVRYDDSLDPTPKPAKPGKLTAKFVIPANTLGSGVYRIEIDVGIHMLKRIVSKEGMLQFQLDNITGIGRQFPLTDVKGSSSLLRPHWALPRTSSLS